MKRYVNIHDIRGTRSWAHHPSARLYMYLCMCCDYQTGLWVGTRRRTSLEVGLTDQEYRTALKNLELDGLIEVATGDDAAPIERVTQRVTQRLSQHLTQRATQITVVIMRELGGGTSPKGQPNKQPKEQPKEQPSINNNNTKKPYSLTLARASAPSLIDAVADYIHGSREDGTAAIRAFLDAMRHKGKTWEDEQDFRAHLMDWTLKRWQGAESRLSAENRQRARAERDRAAAELADGKAAKAEQEKFIISWIEAVRSSKRAHDMVSTWARNGRLNNPDNKEIITKWATANPEAAELTWRLLDWQPDKTE